MGYSVFFTTEQHSAKQARTDLLAQKLVITTFLSLSNKGSNMMFFLYIWSLPEQTAILLYSFRQNSYFVHIQLSELKNILIEEIFNQSFIMLMTEISRFNINCTNIRMLCACTFTNRRLLQGKKILTSLILLFLFFRCNEHIL